MAYIYKLPSRVDFVLKDTTSENKIVINYQKGDNEIEIRDYYDTAISINKNDIEWFIEALRDVKSLYEETLKEV